MDPGIGDDDDEYDDLYKEIPGWNLAATVQSVPHNSEKIVAGKAAAVVPTQVNPAAPNYIDDRSKKSSVPQTPIITNLMDPDGNRKLIVGELHWWTTDADVEMVIYKYGKVKEIKFFDVKESGKSKGYCQVEFYDPAAAAACKEGLHGHLFNGRPCVVAFSTPHIIRQMDASYTNKLLHQNQLQAGRGRGGRGVMGNAPAGHGFGRPPPGMMHPPQGMMGGPGFDLAFMVRGGGYGGFSGPAFPGLMLPPPYPPAMGLPHVNPAFFGRGMAPNLMGMDGHHSGIMWGGWGGDNASEYGHGVEASQEEKKGVVRSTSASREKERNSDKRHLKERDHEHQQEKDRYHGDRGQSSRSHSRMRGDDHRSRFRDADYEKR